MHHIIRLKGLIGLRIPIIDKGIIGPQNRQIPHSRPLAHGLLHTPQHPRPLRIVQGSRLTAAEPF